MNVIIFILAFIGCAYLFFIGVAVVEYFINLEKRVKKNETDIEMFEQHYSEQYWKELKEDYSTSDSEITDYD